MATLVNFDQYYQNYPEIKKELDFEIFWKDALFDLKKFPIEPEFKENKRRSNANFTVYDVLFKSFGKTQIHSRLVIPKKAKKVLRPVIMVHDYMAVDPYKGYALKKDFAYLLIELRGHHIIKNTKAKTEGKKSVDQESPGFMIENILDPENYYVKGVYLDILRSIEVLRLNENLDCSRIGIIGKGLGAAAAVFAASRSDRICGVVLESLAFADLEKSQNMAEGYITEEINEFANKARGRKKVLKRNLTYFDAINFADTVKVPVLMVTGTKAHSSPTECVFSFFNYLPIHDKTIEVYPDEGVDAGGNKQFTKSINWLKRRVYGTK
jgi:cephalosporin-C deacetylase-like acetyl esterase